MTKRAILFEAVSTGIQASTDKQSLPEQDARLNEIAVQKGWEVVDTILIPGHSRVYYTYREFAEAALDEGIADPMRMFEHWRKEDFDIFACASGDRFGREQSIFAEVVGRTIDAGAVVFTIRDGEINKGNRRMFVSMGGYQASIEVDEIQRRRNFGMNKRAERGLPTSSHIVRSHMIIRDELGNAIRLEVDESQRRMWEDVYHLFVEQHVPWGQLEANLAVLGHTDPDGKPMRKYGIFETVRSPSWWGDSARFYADEKLSKGREWAWVYDPSQSPPEGVLLHRNTHPAVYTGEQRRKFIAEIERRKQASKGRSKPYRSNRYAGVLVCRDCGYYMTYSGNGRYPYISCRTNNHKQVKCSNTGGLRPSQVDTYIHALLERRAQGETLADILEIKDETAQNERRKLQLEIEIGELIEQSRRLIRKQGKAGLGLEDIYDDELAIISGKRTALERQLADLTNYNGFNSAEQEREVADIIQMGEKFWQLSDTEINVRLCRMLGNRRPVAYRGEIRWFADAPRNTRRS